MLENKFLFTEEDYNVFDPEITKSTDPKHGRQRTNTKNKLLSLHYRLYPKIELSRMNVYKHSNEKNITSYWFPNEHNNFDVHWIGLRYGEDPKVIKMLDFDTDKDDTEKGFLKHQCYQINIEYTGMEVSIYHNTPRNTWDYGYTMQHIDDGKFQKELIHCIEQLKGLGLKWYIGQDVFNIDERNSQEVIQFYKSHLGKSEYNCILVDIPRYSPMLLDTNIVETCLYYMDKMYNLYSLMRWKENER